MSLAWGFHLATLSDASNLTIMRRHVFEKNMRAEVVVLLDVIDRISRTCSSHLS